MRLTDIAVSNLKVRKTKMLFLMLGMIIGVATIVALSTVASALQVQLTEHFEQQGVNVAVTPQSEQFSLSYSGVPVTSEVMYENQFLPLPIVEKIKQHAAVGTVSPKLVMPVELASGESNLVVGLEPQAENELKAWWQIEKGNFPTEGKVLLGNNIAAEISRDTDETVEVNGQSFAVAGILAETGKTDDNLIFMTLKDAGNLLAAPNRISFVEFNLPGRVAGEEETKTVLTEIASLLPGVELSEVKGQQQARREVADRFTSFAALVSLVVFIIGCSIIMITMMSSVNERTKEIGIFRAIGFRKSHVARIILTEAAIVSLIAGLVGYLIGMAAAVIASSFMVQLDVNKGVEWDLLFAFSVLTASLVVGLLSSFYPAWRATKLDPTEALRHL